MTRPMPTFPYNRDGQGDIQAIDFIQWVAAYNLFADEWNAEHVTAAPTIPARHRLSELAD